MSLPGFLNYRYLFKQLVLREVGARYRGSMGGMIWVFFQPLLMLVIYTYVFSIVFNARWDGLHGTTTQQDPYFFGLALFTSLIVFNLFSECIVRAPLAIVGNPAYVKKVSFPLGLLTIVYAATALFQAAASFMILAGFYGLLTSQWPLFLVFLPIILVPLVILICGISWILNSLGVYIKDTAQIVPTLVTLLMFLTPVFYPLSKVPDKLQPYIMLNPLTFYIESTRNLVLKNELPTLENWLIYFAASCIIAYFGFWWFKKTKNGFADVL